MLAKLLTLQVPNRDEPDCPGEIDYSYVLHLLEKTGYRDWIGLEYTPRTFTNDGLGWIRKLDFEL